MGVLLRSSASGTWYFVEEFRVTTITSQTQAIKYSAVYGDSVAASSSAIQEMQSHAAENRAALVAEIVAAINGV